MACYVNVFCMTCHTTPSSSIPAHHSLTPDIFCKHFMNRLCDTHVYTHTHIYIYIHTYIYQNIHKQRRSNFRRRLLAFERTKEGSTEHRWRSRHTQRYGYIHHSRAHSFSQEASVNQRICGCQGDDNFVCHPSAACSLLHGWCCIAFLL